MHNYQLNGWGQCDIQGNIVNVPTNVDKIQIILFRLTTCESTIVVCGRRKLKYKSFYSYLIGIWENPSHQNHIKINHFKYWFYNETKHAKKNMQYISSFKSKFDKYILLHLHLNNCAIVSILLFKIMKEK